MPDTTFDLASFDVAEFDRILSRGLSKGLGLRGQQVCIEAAICQVLHLSHGDDPGCVAAAVRSFKITLNDGPWSSPQARAIGLRDLGLAQLGSSGVVSDVEFAKRIAEKTIRVILPKLFRQVFPKDQSCLEASDRCEREGTEAAAWAAAAAARAAAAAAAAADAAAAAARAAAAAAAAAARAAAAAEAEAAWAAAWAAWAAAWAAAAAAEAGAAAAEAGAAGDEYLSLSASLALEVLRDLNSPGIQLLAGRVA